jgi:hypothetical protein
MEKKPTNGDNGLLKQHLAMSKEIIEIARAGNTGNIPR